MLDLIMYIQSKLSKINNGVTTINGNATENTKYPYVSFNIPTLNGQEIERNVLEIDVWDMSVENDITKVETITDNIVKELKRKYELTDNFIIKFEQNTPFRQTIPDPDYYIQRRRLNYILKIVRRN